MIDKQNIVAAVTELLERAKIERHAKYLSARQIEAIYGIPAKTILNRSNLSTIHHRFIPSVRLHGGRKKYFERKVIERLINIGSTNA